MFHDMKYILMLLVVCMNVLALEPREVAVVYNADSALSKAAALRYCTVRRIPRDQLLPVYGVKRGDMTRDEFDGMVTSLLTQARSRGLMWPAGPRNGRKLMRAMVLMPDIPLRIKESTPEGQQPAKGMRRNEAAVDSELMLLGSHYPLNGMGNNPHYRKSLPTGNEPQKVMMVCRIDGPNEECVYRMINDPANVERFGLWGWVVVDQGGPYPQGDALMKRVAELAQEHHQPLFYETSRSTLAQAFPLMQEVGVYFGWYIRNANGPFGSSAPADFRFARGAIASHLHSFSAISLYDGKSWVSALLRRGACVTAGNVSEPYLNACLNYGVFYEHLLAGAQVGEAALLATPFVSWQAIVLGDPLYRPFPPNAVSGGGNPYAAWREFCRRANGNLQALQRAVEQKRNSPHAAVYAEMLAWHYTELKQFEQAAAYFKLAERRYSRSRDKLRVAIMQASTMAAAGDVEGAKAVFLILLDVFASSPHLPAIQMAAKAVGVEIVNQNAPAS